MAEFFAMFDGAERIFFNLNISRNTPLPNQITFGIDLTNDIAVNTVFMLGARPPALNPRGSFLRHHFPGSINRISIGTAAKVVILKFVDKFPQNIAIPVHFNEFTAFTREICRAFFGPLGRQQITVR